jgi:hypothetical protein
VSFAAVTLFVASQRVFTVIVVAVVYLVIDSLLTIYLSVMINSPAGAESHYFITDN